MGSPGPSTRSRRARSAAREPARTAPRGREAPRFGTSGWRGVLGDEVTDERVRAVAHGVATWVRSRRGSRRVVVGFDGRFASARLAEVVSGVLRARGLAVLQTPGPAPTPAVARAVCRHRADGAVMLTASPPKDVSLNLCDISSPVCFMAEIQASSVMM